jgi:tripartite-type tricarboxylate transporter receptor subunit TctC
VEHSAAHKLHDGGKARILAVATDKRLDIMPDIPTLNEVGLQNFVSDTWNAISAPPKTPRPIVAKLNRTINDIVNEAETKERFRALNLIAAAGTPEDMAKLKREETERWSKVIRDANVKPE